MVGRFCEMLFQRHIAFSFLELSHSPISASPPPPGCAAAPPPVGRLLMKSARSRAGYLHRFDTRTNLGPRSPLLRHARNVHTDIPRSPATSVSFNISRCIGCVPSVARLTGARSTVTILRLGLLHALHRSEEHTS